MNRLLTTVSQLLAAPFLAVLLVAERLMRRRKRSGTPVSRGYEDPESDWWTGIGSP